MALPYKPQGNRSNSKKLPLGDSDILNIILSGACHKGKLPKTTMIIKSKDSCQPQIDQLKKLLSLNLPNSKKEKIEAEKRKSLAGIKGEFEAARYIDHYLSMTKNSAVIHDLRIEHRGKSAQIDHLIINRFLEFFILESKNFKSGAKINDRGEFSLIAPDGTLKAIPSPIEQNDRHRFLLGRFLRDKDIMPRRMGKAMSPTLKSYVIFSPKSKITRPPDTIFDTSSVTHSDKTFKQVAKIDFGSWISIHKLVSGETMKKLARAIVSCHKPMQFDYWRKFNVEMPAYPKKFTLERFFCTDCKKEISEAEYTYCKQRRGRFQGKAYCRQCQKYHKPI